jgi:hypothetical protein
MAETKINTNEITDASVTISKISNPYRFSAYRSANVNLTSGLWTTVACNTEDFDPSNMHSNGVFTAPIAGYYYLSAQANASVGAGGTQAVGISLVHSAGGNIIYVLQRSVDGLTDLSVCGSVIAYFAAGATATFQVYANGAGQAIYTGSASKLTRFCGYLVSI